MQTYLLKVKHKFLLFGQGTHGTSSGSILYILSFCIVYKNKTLCQLKMVRSPSFGRLSIVSDYIYTISPLFMHKVECEKYLNNDVVDFFDQEI